LATDGEPNCASGSTSASNLPATVDAIIAARAAGFLVYVIGIGPSVGNLDNFAAAGGTTNYFPATSPQAMTDAFTSISKAVSTCTFNLTQAPPDANNVAVYLDKSLVAKDSANGWTMGANALTVVLNGSTCDKVTSGAATQVQVLFGCPGTSPPLFLP
jgi:type IV pilus assembly protein PilY1